MIVKTVTSEDARTRLRDVMDEVITGESEIIIERHGKPMVAVISYKEFQRIQQQREKRRAKLANVRADMEAGNYMTWEQVEAELIAKGVL